jgi:hypothetical protein
MPALIALALKLGVPPKFAKAATIAALFVLAMSLLALGKCAYDRSIINTHEAKQEAATAKADRKADTAAAEQRRVDDSRLTTEAQELNRSTDHAQTDLDRRLAFQRCLRLQQAARAKHGVVPACH